MGWIARLNTGEEVVEPEVEIKDELSPWHLLIERCRRENLRIVQLSLRKGRVLVTAIPNAPGYVALYDLRTSMRGQRPALLQGIGSVSNEMIFINWIDEEGRITQEIRPLGQNYVHTTQREKRDLF